MPYMDDYFRFWLNFTHFYSVHVTVKLDKQVLSGTTYQHIVIWVTWKVRSFLTLEGV